MSVRHKTSRMCKPLFHIWAWKQIRQLYELSCSTQWLYLRAPEARKSPRLAARPIFLTERHHCAPTALNRKFMAPLNQIRVLVCWTQTRAGPRMASYKGRQTWKESFLLVHSPVHAPGPSKFTPRWCIACRFYDGASLSVVLLWESMERKVELSYTKGMKSEFTNELLLIIGYFFVIDTLWTTLKTWLSILSRSWKIQIFRNHLKIGQFFYPLQCICFFHLKIGLWS